jgi:hypothetical protein
MDMEDPPFEQMNEGGAETANGGPSRERPAKRRKAFPQYDGPAYDSDDDLAEVIQEEEPPPSAGPSTRSAAKGMKPLSTVASGMRKRSEKVVRSQTPLSQSQDGRKGRRKGLVMAKEDTDFRDSAAPGTFVAEMQSLDETADVPEDQRVPPALNDTLREDQPELEQEPAMFPAEPTLVPGAADLNLWSTPSSQDGGELNSRQIFGSPPLCVSPERLAVATNGESSIEPRDLEQEPDDFEMLDAERVDVGMGMDLDMDEPVMAESSRLLKPSGTAPTLPSLLATLKERKLSEVAHRTPFYSDPKDVPARIRNVAGRDFRIPGNGVETLAPFVSSFGPSKTLASLPASRIGSFKAWTPVVAPPDSKSLLASLRSVANPVVDAGHKRDEQVAQVAENSEGLIALPPRRDVSQLEGPTPDNTYGFKFDQNKTDSITHTQQYLTILSVECHGERARCVFQGQN